MRQKAGDFITLHNCIAYLYLYSPTLQHDMSTWIDKRVYCTVYSKLCHMCARDFKATNAALLTKGNVAPPWKRLCNWVKVFY